MTTWKPLCALLLGVALLAAPAHAAELEGVRFDERLREGDIVLQLQGVGLLRYRVVFRGYVAALYLGEGAGPESALDDAPRRLEIEYFWAIPRGAFADATREGIRRNVSAEALERLSPTIERFSSLYEDVEPGDRYALTYLPGVGTELARNGRSLGVVAGAEFAAAIFSIWLGESPLDEGLKEQLLARS